MIALTLAEVAEVVGGRLEDCPDASELVTGPASADSREVHPGGLFAAITGERVDGHSYVDAALAGGAVAALTGRPVGRPAIVVDDVVEALGRLATEVLRRLPHLRVVAITGSSGKTSTKDLVAQVAEQVGPTVAPPGSYNTEVGLPLTVLRADERTKVLVLEMGARGPGHIAYLCGVARPDIGVVLNVGHAHVGEFGSLAAVAAAKAELVEQVGADGLVVLGIDDPVVAAMAGRAVAPVVGFGRGGSADVQAQDVRLAAGGRAQFRLRTPEGEAPVSLRLVGDHQVDNALAAAACGRALGLDVETVAVALGGAVARSPWRMEVSERADGVVVVNDAYNANPESVRAALRALVDIAAGRRTWVVLGEMRELGAAHEEAHEQVGRWAGELGVDRIVAVGAGAATVLRGAGLAGSAGHRTALVPDIQAAVALLLDQVEAGDVVLVKASRAVGLERVAQALLDAGPEGGGSA